MEASAVSKDTKQATRMPIAGYEFRGMSIPDYMADAMQLWIDRGIYPGSFLTAVLENDLAEACGRADENNLRVLPAYIAYLYNEAPSACWGSPTKCAQWSKARAALASADRSQP